MGGAAGGGASTTGVAGGVSGGASADAGAVGGSGGAGGAGGGASGASGFDTSTPGAPDAPSTGGIVQGENRVGSSVGGSSGSSVDAGDARDIESVGSSGSPGANADVDINVNRDEARMKNEMSAGNIAPGSQSPDATLRSGAGYQGQSVMAGGDGGAQRTVDSADLAGTDGAAIDARNATSSEGSLKAKAGVDTGEMRHDAGIDAPRSSTEVAQNREWHARDEAMAQAREPEDRAREAEQVYRDPAMAAEARGEAKLDAEASEHRPDTMVQAEQRAASARAARDASRNPETVAENKLDDELDEKKANVQADVGVKVTTKPDPSDT
ncbi:MAG: hypothetical protein AB7T06_26520 [Kofleriaceae bacterium]